jgi:hypothetical protein
MRFSSNGVAPTLLRIFVWIFRYAPIITRKTRPKDAPVLTQNRKHIVRIYGCDAAYYHIIWLWVMSFPLFVQPSPGRSMFNSEDLFVIGKVKRDSMET